MTDDIETIKDKIAKLLAKAEGTDNQDEAALFMAKVEQLLERHQIDMFAIREHAGRDNDPMGHDRGTFNMYASMTWAKLLVGQIAKYYGADTLWGKNGNHLTYGVYGRESARMTTELMIPFIISQVRQKARVYLLDAHARGHTKITASIAQREVGQALAVRIASLIRAANANRAALAEKALVPFNDVAAYMKECVPDMKEGKSRKVEFSRTAREHADAVSLHTQVQKDRRKMLG